MALENRVVENMPQLLMGLVGVGTGLAVSEQTSCLLTDAFDIFLRNLLFFGFFYVVFSILIAYFVNWEHHTSDRGWWMLVWHSIVSVGVTISLIATSHAMVSNSSTLQVVLPNLSMLLLFATPLPTLVLGRRQVAELIDPPRFSQTWFGWVIILLIVSTFFGMVYVQSWVPMPSSFECRPLSQLF